MWMCHHLFHENITFLKLNDPSLANILSTSSQSIGIFISLMIVMAALIKSAQLPFTSWLPRAMEGPTTSSAIFYGSLSVHLGAFILLRTFPFWENFGIIKIAVIGMGLATSIIATGIARVQSTVKTQIAYSSAAQIGIIFIEIALGFHLIALIHFAGNAFLRTYQLLVSPSVLSYLIHDQFYHFNPENRSSKNSAFNKISHTFYILCIREWNMDFLLHRYLWNPFKWIGNKFSFFTGRFTLFLLGVIYVFGLYSFYYGAQNFLYGYLPYIFAFIALILILNAFTARTDARRNWILVFASQFFIALAIALNKQFEFSQIILYLSGGMISAIAGYFCLAKIESIDNDIRLDKFHGYAYEHPQVALVFLISCLGLLAFPITPSFIGFDILITHIEKDQALLIFFTALCFIFIELSVLRIYARIFLGQHKKAYHPIAYRSS
jgi:NADH:ubiquinone oxidoreductase subunit 5 (subunit L)/multisubunit Na+/H+ antiporter MnhA subunit